MSGQVDESAKDGTAAKSAHHIANGNGSAPNARSLTFAMGPSASVESANPQSKGKPSISFASLCTSQPPKALKMSASTPPAANGYLSPTSSSIVAFSSSEKVQGKSKASMDTPSCLPSPPRPLPDGQSYLTHSHLFHSPSPPPTGTREMEVPLDSLKSELNNESDGLIPLAAVVERVASESYDTLLNLGET